MQFLCLRKRSIHIAHRLQYNAPCVPRSDVLPFSILRWTTENIRLVTMHFKSLLLTAPQGLYDSNTSVLLLLYFCVLD